METFPGSSPSHVTTYERVLLENALLSAPRFAFSVRVYKPRSSPVVEVFAQFLRALLRFLFDVSEYLWQCQTPSKQERACRYLEDISYPCLELGEASLIQQATCPILSTQTPRAKEAQLLCKCGSRMIHGDRLHRWEYAKDTEKD